MFKLWHPPGFSLSVCPHWGGKLRMLPIPTYDLLIARRSRESSSEISRLNKCSEETACRGEPVPNVKSFPYISFRRGLLACVWTGRRLNDLMGQRCLSNHCYVEVTGSSRRLSLQCVLLKGNWTLFFMTYQTSHFTEGDARAGLIWLGLAWCFLSILELSRSSSSGEKSNKKHLVCTDQWKKNTHEGKAHRPCEDTLQDGVSDEGI